MRHLVCALALAALVSAAGCSREEPALEIAPGSQVTVQKKDGVTVSGRLVEVKAERVVVESPDGVKTDVPRSQIATVRAEPKPTSQSVGSTGAAAPASSSSGTATSGTGNAAPSNPLTKLFDRGPQYREVIIPAGTVLALELQSAVASDSSNVEDPVRATLRRGITVGGVEAVPAGSAVLGNVTAVERSGRVKGRAQIAFRFNRIDPVGNAERLAIQTGTVSRVAEATKKQDAAKIGGGAVGGAIVGGLLGGGDGAAKGAAVGGAAGTGVVLATRGKEVRLGPGADISVKLAAPVTVRVLIKK
jgi:hypothetical protein